jgi:hypothetical protein
MEEETVMPDTDTQPADNADQQADAPPNDQQQPQGDPADKPLGENGEKALKAERERANTAERERVALQKRLDELEAANLSELEKAQRRAEKAEKTLADLEANALRQRIALEKGLPANLVPRLQGSTEEELAADADALLELVKAPTGPRPDPSQGARGGDPKATTADQFAAALQGQF